MPFSSVVMRPGCRWRRCPGTTPPRSRRAGEYGAEAAQDVVVRLHVVELGLGRIARPARRRGEVHAVQLVPAGMDAVKPRPTDPAAAFNTATMPSKALLFA